MTVVIVAAAALVVALLAVGAGAGGPAYAVKVRVIDKSSSASWFEGIVLEQTKGKSSILGDKLVFRLLTRATTFNKDAKKQKSSGWLSSLKTDDLVTATGGYKSTDKTFEVTGKAVNRSR